MGAERLWRELLAEIEQFKLNLLSYGAGESPRRIQVSTARAASRLARSCLGRRKLLLEMATGTGKTRTAAAHRDPRELLDELAAIEEEIAQEVESLRLALFTI